jgi:hypothetical protein
MKDLDYSIPFWMASKSAGPALSLARPDAPALYVPVRM